MNIKHVLEHVVYFEHTGPHGEELPVNAPVPVWDDPYSTTDDQLVAILTAVKELEAPGDTVELRARRHMDTAPSAFVHVSLEGAGRFAIRISHAQGFSREAEERLRKEGFQPAAGDKGSEWLLDNYAAAVDSLPSYLDELLGYVLALRDDYDVDEVPEGGTSASSE